ncbi:hypothetical protein COBT_000876 [Conglomerata obtusa]
MPMRIRCSKEYNYQGYTDIILNFVLESLDKYGWCGKMIIQAAQNDLKGFDLVIDPDKNSFMCIKTGVIYKQFISKDSQILNDFLSKIKLQHNNIVRVYAYSSANVAAQDTIKALAVIAMEKLEMINYQHILFNKVLDVSDSFKNLSVSCNLQNNMMQKNLKCLAIDILSAFYYLRQSGYTFHHILLHNIGVGMINGNQIYRILSIHKITCLCSDRCQCCDINVDDYVGNSIHDTKIYNVSWFKNYKSTDILFIVLAICHIYENQSTGFDRCVVDVYSNDYVDNLTIRIYMMNIDTNFKSFLLKCLEFKETTLERIEELLSHNVYL